MSLNEILLYIKNNNITRINIIGSPASGKSTLAKKLSDDLNWQVIDLDEKLYSVKCKRLVLNQDIEVLNKILNNKNIIIDGTYSSSINKRTEKIDLFILTSSNRFQCLIRFILRLLKNKNLKCGEKLTLKTLELILNYNQIEKQLISTLSKNKIIRFVSYE